MSVPVGAINFDRVSKRYRLGLSGTLRDALAGLRGRGGADDRRTLWALRDVSFGVAPGDALALIGPNGAGKTTVLKLLSKITRPTHGRLAVGGRLSTLIELGAGFHPELTGRANIYLNGTILGLRRAEIRRRFDAIVAFSELEKFIDTPVKRYSSGMYVRLAFAVAAHVEPDVLLVDEVLAVGDSAFRQRCMTRMEALRSRGTTLLFVSHNMYQVRRLCDRALLLVKGEVQFAGPTGDAIAAYEESVQAADRFAPSGTNGRSPAHGIIITDVSLTDDDGAPVTRRRHDEPLIVHARYRTAGAVVNPIVKIRLVRADGEVATMVASRYAPGTQWTLQSAGVISCRFEPNQLATGAYAAEVRVIDGGDTAVLAAGQSGQFLVRGPAMPHEVDTGHFVPNVSWTCEEGEAMP